MTNPIDIAFLLSGGGSTLKNLLDHIEQGKVDGRVQIVISSDSEAYGLVRAKRAGIPQRVVEPDEFPDTESFSQQITKHLEPVDPDLICMGGFLHFYQIPEKYQYRIINIHPSLLPAYGGEGFYGHHVHEAVLEAEENTSGCSVHFATNEGYDRGPIILQAEVPVKPDDTPETLGKRVKKKEREIYPEAIQLFAEDRIDVENGEVHIRE